MIVNVPYYYMLLFFITYNKFLFYSYSIFILASILKWCYTHIRRKVFCSILYSDFKIEHNYDKTQPYPKFAEYTKKIKLMVYAMSFLFIFPDHKLSFFLDIYLHIFSSHSELDFLFLPE